MRMSKRELQKQPKGILAMPERKYTTVPNGEGFDAFFESNPQVRFYGTTPELAVETLLKMTDKPKVINMNVENTAGPESTQQVKTLRHHSFVPPVNIAGKSYNFAAWYTDNPGLQGYGETEREATDSLNTLTREKEDGKDTSGT